jgi:hypothetical protein
VARLASALEALDGEPAIVVANVGTVNTGDFDDLRDRHPFWLHVVCFTLTDDPAGIGGVAQAVTDSGEAFLTTTVYDGVPALRAAFSSWRTTEDDVDRVAKALSRAC